MGEVGSRSPTGIRISKDALEKVKKDRPSSSPVDCGLRLWLVFANLPEALQSVDYCCLVPRARVHEVSKDRQEHERSTHHCPLECFDKSFARWPLPSVVSLEIPEKLHDGALLCKRDQFLDFVGTSAGAPARFDIRIEVGVRWDSDMWIGGQFLDPFGRRFIGCRSYSLEPTALCALEIGVGVVSVR